MKKTPPKVIFITGTLSAGKDTVAEHCVGKGFSHFSARTFLTDLLKQRNLEPNRAAMSKLGNDLRKEFGPDYLIRTLYERALKGGKDAIIESVRNPGEIEFLRSKPNTHLLAVDAEQKRRYDWAVNRASPTDKVSFEEFQAQEKLESEGTDPWAQNLPACIKAADYTVHNDGDLPELYHQVNDFFQKIRPVKEKV